MPTRATFRLGRSFVNAAVCVREFYRLMACQLMATYTRSCSGVRRRISYRSYHGGEVPAADIHDVVSESHCCMRLWIS